MREVGDGYLVGVNVGFIEHLQRLHPVLKDGGTYRFWDYGWGSVDDVRREQYPQVRTSAEGQITSDMNFPLTLAAAEHIGYKVDEVKSQQEFVSEAFGEPVVSAHTILRTHGDFVEGVDVVLLLMKRLKRILADHYRGEKRYAKAKRVVESNFRMLGRPASHVKQLMEAAEKQGSFRRQSVGENIEVATYLLGSEVEPALPKLAAAGFSPEKIREYLELDPWMKNMRYVVLGK